MAFSDIMGYDNQRIHQRIISYYRRYGYGSFIKLYADAYGG